MILPGSIFVFSIDKWHIEIDCGKENDIKTEYGEAYDDTAATAALKGRYLLKNGFPAAVTSEGSVDTSKLGNYTITYHASFLFWKGEATKTVRVVDTIPPEIKLVTDPDHYTLPGHPYEEEGYSATDNVDGDLTKEVTSEEKDGNIITGKGPGAAMEFALAVVELLQGKDKVAELKEAMIV